MQRLRARPRAPAGDAPPSARVARAGRAAATGASSMFASCAASRRRARSATAYRCRSFRPATDSCPVTSRSRPTSARSRGCPARERRAWAGRLSLAEQVDASCSCVRATSRSSSWATTTSTRARSAERSASALQRSCSAGPRLPCESSRARTCTPSRSRRTTRGASPAALSDSRARSQAGCSRKLATEPATVSNLGSDASAGASSRSAPASARMTESA